MDVATVSQFLCRKQVLSVARPKMSNKGAGKPKVNLNANKAPIDAKFDANTNVMRVEQLGILKEAKTEYGNKLDFAGYMQGHDPAYLGINRGNYYAKPFGNDSSNVQAVIGGMSYWRRVYYRPGDSEGYAAIRAEMESLVHTVDKPHIQLSFPGERIQFHNTLKFKYTREVGGQRRSFSYDRQGHRSSPTEIAFIASNYQRKDRDLVILPPK